MSSFCDTVEWLVPSGPSPSGTFKFLLNVPYLTTQFPQRNTCFTCINEKWSMKIDPVPLWGSDVASFTPTTFGIPTDWNLASFSAQFEALEITTYTIIFPATLCKARPEASLMAWNESADLWPVFQLLTRLVIRRCRLLRRVCIVKLGKDQPQDQDLPNIITPFLQNKFCAALWGIKNGCMFSHRFTERAADYILCDHSRRVLLLLHSSTSNLKKCIIQSQATEVIRRNFLP